MPVSFISRFPSGFVVAVNTAPLGMAKEQKKLAHIRVNSDENVPERHVLPLMLPPIAIE
jgi:hypothetical protein